jgi:hypothetical protein
MHVSTIFEFLAGSFFTVWLGLTVAFQFPRFQVPMRVRDPFYMLPSWSFFAPLPNTSDYLLLLRYESHGQLTPWRQPHLLSFRSILLLWDPERRQRKAVIDISQSIAEFVIGKKPELVYLTTPYLLLLQFASLQPEAVFATGVQVAISVRPAHHGDYELFFQSHLHPIEQGIACCQI